MDVTIYDAVNFGGRSAILAVGGTRLSGPGAPIAKVSSIKVPSGTVAVVYELADNAGGYGRSADLMEDYADVSTLGLAGISYVEIFLAQREAPVRTDAPARTAAAGATTAVAGATTAAAGATTAAVQEVWARGAVVNGTYVAGHWQVGAQVATLGTVFVSPGPLPHLLHITNIQGQDWTNPPYNVSSSNWSSQVVGGATYDASDAHPYEWVSVLNPTLEQDDEVGVAGFAVAVDLSGADLPFTHPFGGDFEFGVVPDAAYTNLLAPRTMILTRPTTTSRMPFPRAAASDSR